MIDNPATWLILVTLVIYGLIKLLQALPNQESHAYDRYNAEIDKKRKGYWV